MQAFPHFISDNMTTWVALGAGILVGSLALLVRKILMARLGHWAKNTDTSLDDILLDAVRVPSLLWCAIITVAVTVKIVPLQAGLGGFLDRALQALWLGSLTLATAQILSQLVRVYARKFEAALPVTTLTENLVRLLVLGLGGLMILQSFGISIAPVLATLGIGGLAVALALQDTLANLFSGLHIILSRQIKVGDFLRLENGEEGYVTDINWRTTKVKMLANNTVLIPNAKLAQAVVVNYHDPEKELAVLVQVGVHYDSDLRMVERVTCEVGKETMTSVPGGVPEFNPFIRYHTFADFSINFTVILRGREFVDQYLLKHEFICRLHERYRQEGIIIPYPIRAINQTQERPPALPAEKSPGKDPRGA